MSDKTDGVTDTVDSLDRLSAMSPEQVRETALSYVKAAFEKHGGPEEAIVMAHEGNLIAMDAIGALVTAVQALSGEVSRLKHTESQGKDILLALMERLAAHAELPDGTVESWLDEMIAEAEQTVEQAQASDA